MNNLKWNLSIGSSVCPLKHVVRSNVLDTLQDAAQKLSINDAFVNRTIVYNEDSTQVYLYENGNLVSSTPELDEILYAQFLTNLY